MTTSTSMNPLQYTLIVALLTVGPGLSSAQENGHLSSLPITDGPVEVQIGFQLFDITDVNEKEETVEFEGGIYLMWMDPRQAYDPAEWGYSRDDWVPGDYSSRPRRIYQGHFAVEELFQGWRPRIDLTNGIGNRQTNNQAVGVWPDGMMAYAEHFSAKAETPFNLKRFPFDRQSVKMYFHPFFFPRSDVLLVQSDALSGTWFQDTGIADWKKSNLEFRERPLEYTLTDGDKAVYSQLVVTLDMARRPGNVLFSIIFPLLVLVSLTWCVFWMDEEATSNRVNISLVGILSVVAYYFVVLDSVPKIPYLTMMDAFMIATFLILASTVVVSIVVDKLNRAGRKSTGDRVDRVSRWAFPLGYTLVIVGIVIVYFQMD